MTDAEMVAAIAPWQDRIRLSAAHRYQWEEMPGKWSYVYGTTTVIKQNLAAPGLLDWAARLGAETGDPRAHIKARDEAGDKGTSMHALFERECRLMAGETVGDMPPATEDELMALERWRRWAKDAAFRPLMAEFRVFHPGMFYAGTVDVLGYVRGKLTVVDWKTSPKAYPEHFLQSAAYRSALAAMVGCEAPEGHIVRLPRDGDVASEWPVTLPLDETQRAFEALLTVHKWKKAFEKGKAA